MNKTNIEYLTHTWNPITMRCTPVSEACENCWHLRMADRLAANPTIPQVRQVAYSGGKPLLIEEILGAPLRKKKPAVIGIQFMGDLFHDDVNEKWIGRVIGHIAAAHWHTFMILTKRPQNAAEFCHAIAHYPKGDESKKPITGLPPNLYFGITAETQWRYHERWSIAQKIPASKLFVSVEPMLSHVSISGFLTKPDWVICGAETGPGARPMDPDWARDLRDQVKAANIPFFMKAMSNKEPIPSDLQIRECPKED